METTHQHPQSHSFISGHLNITLPIQLWGRLRSLIANKIIFVCVLWKVVFSLVLNITRIGQHRNSLSFVISFYE